MSSDIKVNRPEPINSKIKTGIFNHETDVQKTIEELFEGKRILIEGIYSNGLTLSHKLNLFLQKKYPNESFQEQRKFRSEYRRLSQLILMQVKDYELVVKKSPDIGWLEKLYPESGTFLLPFPQIQGLNSAWQWYKKGVSIPVLRNKIHPYYGTYFPTRFEHLHLFDNWLKRYKGAKKTAIDVGIGSGVLALQMMKYGFQKVFGTDTNPNVIVGLNEFMNGTKLARKIEIDFGHLFGKWEKQTELIVFNPPWLPASYDLDSMDEAVYYNEKLFPDFFKEAKKRLLPEGKVVLLFSNLGQIINVTKVHPIKEEIENGARFRLDLCLKKSVKPASEKTKRNQHWRSSEEVELWVLSHKK